MTSASFRKNSFIGNLYEKAHPNFLKFDLFSQFISKLTYKAHQSVYFYFLFYFFETFIILQLL